MAALVRSLSLEAPEHRSRPVATRGLDLDGLILILKGELEVRRLSHELITLLPQGLDPSPDGLCAHHTPPPLGSTPSGPQAALC